MIFLKARRAFKIILWRLESPIFITIFCFKMASPSWAQLPKRSFILKSSRVVLSLIWFMIELLLPSGSSPTEELSNSILHNKGVKLGSCLYNKKNMKMPIWFVRQKMSLFLMPLGCTLSIYFQKKIIKKLLAISVRLKELLNKSFWNFCKKILTRLEMVFKFI